MIIKYEGDKPRKYFGNLKVSPENKDEIIKISMDLKNVPNWKIANLMDTIFSLLKQVMEAHDKE